MNKLDLAPAPKRGNMLTVYSVFGQLPLSLRVICKLTKFDKKKTLATLHNLTWRGYILKAGAVYCINTREGYEKRKAEIAKTENDKKAAAAVEPVKNAQHESAFNAARKDHVGGMNSSAMGGIGQAYAPPDEYAEQQDKLIAIAKGEPVKESWLTKDRMYMGLLAVILLGHLLHDAGVF